MMAFRESTVIRNSALTVFRTFSREKVRGAVARSDPVNPYNQLRPLQYSLDSEDASAYSICS